MDDQKTQNTTKDLHGYVKFPSSTTKKNDDKPVKKVEDSIPARRDKAAPLQRSTTRKPLKKPTQKLSPKPSRKSFDKPFGGMGDMPGFGSPSRNSSQKTESIKKIYKEILGKEPTNRDLSYYRFSPMTEDEIREQVLKGEEHKSLIKKGREYDDIKDDMEDYKVKVKRLEKKLEDNLEEFKEINDLLKEKNKYIRQLREKIDETNEVLPNESTYEYESRITPTTESTNIVPQPKIDESIPKPPPPQFTDNIGTKMVKKKNLIDRIFRS